MTDYWVSKLFFDLQQDPKLAAEYRADMAGVIGRYEIKPELRKALLEDDVGALAPLVNAYLLRFYFQIRGMPEAEFIARLHALQAKQPTKKEAAQGVAMAELVGVFAASHGPIIARDWEKMPTPHREKLAAGFDEIGRRLTACRPDLLVVVSPDHWVNFFISNLPAVCIGIGEEHDGPPEPFMQKVYPHQRLKGHVAFGRHLLETALDNDFEPALSHRLRLDHGTCIPLWRIGVDLGLPIVPILVNDLEEPMPSIRRCLAWGRLLERAIDSYPEPLRVAVLGTGGLSHSIGETDHGLDRRGIRPRLHRAFPRRRGRAARRRSSPTRCRAPATARTRSATG